MAKPEIIVDAGQPGVKAAVSAGASWTATLSNTDGVRRTAWSVLSTDETSTAASYTLVQSGSVGQNVDGTAQVAGTALLLKAVWNAGINAATGQADPANTSATVKIYVPYADGGEVGCAGEERESDATFGTTGIINAGIRKAAALAPSGVAVKIVRAATDAALPANTRTDNVLTADANGAIGTVGGVALNSGDYLLVQNEGGGASHVNNGAYVLADGDAGTPWTLTRATYFDDSAELIAMTTFRIQEGTYAGKERYLVTSGATINVTPLEFAAFAYAPVDPGYLTVGAVSDLPNERNISAVGTTLDFASTTTIPISASRTDGATAALVDAAQVSALSSGTALAGFGPAVLFKGEVAGGGAENYGRVGFEATDLTGGSEDTKAVLQVRTAGASLATVAEVSGTAVKFPALAGSGSAGVEVDGDGNLTRGAGGGLAAATAVLEDASTALNANGVPVRAAPSSIGFVGVACAPITSTHRTASTGSVVEGFGVGRVITGGGGVASGGEGVRIAYRLPNGFGTATVVATDRVEYTSVLGATVSAKRVWATIEGSALTDRMTLSSLGVLSAPAGLLSASLDAATSGALTLGGTNATSIAVSSLKITGLTAGTATGHAVEYDQMNTAIGAAAFVPTSRTLTGTSPITVAGDNAAHDLSANRTIAFSVGANVPWGGYGITGIASLDNSGGTLDLGANTTAQNVGKASTTWAIRGALTVAGTTGLSDAATITKDGIGSTPTRGATISNSTNSGTQWGAQYGWSAIAGGTQVNMGLQFEPVSSSRQIMRCVYGTGTGAPSSSGPYWDLSDPNLGNGFGSAVFWINSGGIGYRFNNSSNLGGFDQDGSNNNRIKSYSGPGFVVELYSDAGSTLVATPISLAGTGKGRFVATPHVVTSASNAVTFPLATSQNIRHTTTEDTTVTITGAVAGMHGAIDVLQGATGRVVTMPINGVGIEYDAATLALNGGVDYQDYVIDQTANTRTVLTYYVTDTPATRLIITSRFVHVLP